MEDDGDILFDFCKEFYRNDKKFKNNKIDGLFQKIDKNDYNNNKNIKKISYEKIYIVDKSPIEDIMNKLNYSEYESLLNEQDNKNNDDKIKNKIIEFMKNNPSLKIKDGLQKIKFYSTFDEVKDVFNNNKNIYFLKEEYLKALGIQEKIFKNKFTYFSKVEYVIFLKFNEELDYLMINISDKEKVRNKTDCNTNSNNKKIQIINDKNEQNNKNSQEVKDDQEDEGEKNGQNIKDDQNDEEDKNSQNVKDDQNDEEDKNGQNVKDEKNEENDEVKNNINKNINIVSHHLNFLSSINELNSIDVKDLNDITQIKKVLFDSRGNDLMIDCFLVDCEIFKKFEEEIYYNDCESISLINEESKQEKIEELINRMKLKNKNGIFNNDIKIINGYEECCNLIKSNNDKEFTFVNKKFFDDVNIDKKIYEKSNISLFMANDELFLFFKDKQKIMKVFRTNKYFKLIISIDNLIDVPENIVNNLVSLYMQECKINELITSDMKEHKFENYFLVNRSWLEQYKKYYNYQDIVIKFEMQNTENEEENKEDKKEEDEKEVNNNSKNYNHNYNNNYYDKNYNHYKKKYYKKKDDYYYNNNYYSNNNYKKSNYNKNYNYYGYKNFKNKKNRNYYKMGYNNYNNNNLSSIKNNEYKNSDNIKSNSNKIEKIYDIKVQYENKEMPKLLLEEQNLIPKKFNFKKAFFYDEFDLIEIETLKTLCSHLKINIKPETYELILFRGLLGNDKLILQRKIKDTTFQIFSSRGIFNILNYLLIFNDKNLVDNEINNIKEKGIEKYLLDMSINFYTKESQYLIDYTNVIMIGKVFVVNKKEDSNNEFNKTITNNNSNINNNNINNDNNNDEIGISNHENSNFEIQPNRRYRLGLENIGATCYMNATLQCLCNIPQLQNYFLYNNEISKKPNSKLSRSFGDLMRNLYTKADKKSYAPKQFKELIGNMNPLFRGINANDSKDLILFLYEKIHEELNILNNYNNTEQNLPNELLQFRQNYYSLNSSIIEKTFYSEQITIYQCENCKNETTNYGIQNILIFPLEKIRLNLARRFPNGYICVNLEDCFKELCQPEYMQGENKMYCNNCGFQSDAKYFSKMNNCPEVMTIVLNRGKGNEYDVEFDFPLNINIKNYVHLKNQCTEYNLIAVLVHTGGSDMSGHFFAFCKSNVDNKWYLYNDSIVSECNSDFNNQIKNTGLPYVLFYQRADYLNSQNNNNSNDNITLYFKTYDGKEVYLDANKNELFSNVIIRLIQKYNNINWNAGYYLGTIEGGQMIDTNKTVQQNNLCNYSNITVIN